VLASLDQSLERMGLDYVDIFYSHRFDPDTPLEETCSALASAVQQGKALYVGISSYSAGKTREAAALLRGMGVTPLIHQPSYSLLNRWIEAELLDTLEDTGMGCIAFSALAQGLLSDKYLAGIPQDARINRAGGGSLKAEHLSDANLARVRALNDIAQSRGQSLAQMAVAWVLRDARVSSALIGASRPEQITELAGAVQRLEFSADELAAIDQHAVDGGINLWQRPSTDQRPA
jgi:L-glyceraldehyde 3-phosphate reductase